MKHSLKHWFWDSEFFVPSEARWRKVANVYVVLFAILFAPSFLIVFHHSSRVGSGLGEGTSFDAFAALFAKLNTYGEALGSPIPLVFVIGLMLFGICFRATMVIRGYFRYRDSQGEAFPMQLMMVIGIVNLFNLVAINIVLLVLGVASYLLLQDFSFGWQAVERLAEMAHGWVAAVPTLVELPTAVAVFAVYMLHGFLHYWLHRFGHSYRFGWLLFHRQHHLSPALIYPTTTEVFYAIPLFLFAVVPYTFIFAAAGKLVTAEPLYVWFILINLFVWISEIYGHNTALYKEACNNRFIRSLGWVFLNGPYHYLHHSADPKDAGRHKNVIINLAGGLFGIWDRLFGTYRPLRQEAPPVGLTGQPELHMHPLRLACGGMVQMAYELWHNKSWKTRFWILAGPAEWNPPITHDFALAASGQQKVLPVCDAADEEMPTDYVGYDQGMASSNS